jgi:hypothetical protein
VSCRTEQLYVSDFLSVRDTKPPRFSDHIAFDEFEGALERVRQRLVAYDRGSLRKTSFGALT